MSASNRNVEDWEVKWTRNHIGMLKVRGAWAIPRAGIVFHKTGENEITLTSAMPFVAEMARLIMGDKPLTAKGLLAAQQEEFFNVAARARAGGIAVKSKVDSIKEIEE